MSASPPKATKPLRCTTASVDEGHNRTHALQQTPTTRATRGAEQ